MNILSFVIFVALFVAVTPGVLVTIPKGKNKHIVALVHGLFFGVAWVIVWNLLRIANLTHENLFFEGYVSRPYNNNFQKEYEKAIAEQNKIEKQQREKYERERPERERLAKIQAEKDAAELKKKRLMNIRNYYINKN